MSDRFQHLRLIEALFFGKDAIQETLELIERLQEAGRIRAGRQGQILFLDRLKPLAPDRQQVFDSFLQLFAGQGLGGPRPFT